MTADIVNLRQQRKRKARLEKAAEAEENRRRFGRPGAERRHEKAMNDQDTKRLDGHRRENAAKPSEPDGCN
jgi:hypothetical protein